MPFSEPLVDEPRLAALRRAMPARAFERSVAAFRSSIGKRSADAAAAVSEGRWDDAAHAVHSIKGVSGNFGAFRLAAVSEALEAMIADGETASAPEAVAELSTVVDLTMAALAEALEAKSGS